jgi:hypothetical protein
MHAEKSFCLQSKKDIEDIFCVTKYIIRWMDKFRSHYAIGGCESSAVPSTFLCREPSLTLNETKISNEKQFVTYLISSVAQNT